MTSQPAGLPSLESEIHADWTPKVIHIIHPGLPPAPASKQTEAAFTRVFKPKGWVQITETDAAEHNRCISEGKPSTVLARLAKKEAK